MRTTPSEAPCSATEPAAPILRTICRSSLYAVSALRTVPLACTEPAPSSAWRAWARISSADAAATPADAEAPGLADGAGAAGEADADPVGVAEEARDAPPDDPEQPPSSATLRTARPARAAERNGRTVSIPGPYIG